MTDSSRHRKLWSKSQAPIQLPAAIERKAKSKAMQEYDHHLMMLQERNRLLRRLQRKSSLEVELEKREQGFALYLNGANISRRHRNQAQPSTKDKEHRTKPRERKRNSKTADASHAGRDSSEDEDSPLRAKTAPSKRKAWAHDVVELRTEQGGPLHIQAPGILSGDYEDDFESTVEERDAQLERDELAVSFGDIGVLRSSLEGDDVIRSSLDRTRTESQDSLESLASGSCSEELEEEGEEERGSEQESTGVKDPLCDGIVLEFASLPPSRHGCGRPPMATRSLSAASRKPQQPAGAEPSLHSEVLEAIQWENERVGEGTGRDNHQEGGSVQRQLSLEVEHPIPDTMLPTLNTANESSSDRTEPAEGLASSPHSVAATVRNSCGCPTKSGLSCPLKNSASGSDETSQRRPALGPRDHRQRLPTASDSLTEETLKVITEKVRKMDARKQHRLLHLLSRLDQSSSPLPPAIDGHVRPEPPLLGDVHLPGSASSLTAASPGAPAVMQPVHSHSPETSLNRGKSYTVEQAQKANAASHPTETVRTSHPTETVRTSHPTEAVRTYPTETVRTSHLTEAVRTSHPTETVRTSHPTETVRTSHPTETSQPTETVRTSHPTETVRTSHPTETSQPTETVRTSHPTETVRTSQPTETVRTSHPTETVRTSHPTETVRISHPTETVRTSQPTETVRTSQPTETVRTSHPTETVRTSHPTETVRTSHPTETVRTSHPTETVRTSQPGEHQENSNIEILPSPTPLHASSFTAHHLPPATGTAVARSAASLAQCAHSDSAEIQLCILSNWGHPTLVGLTEVEFFSSLDGKRVWLSSDRVRVRPPSGEGGDPGRLTSGKMKTTSTRHMWTHPYSPGQPLALTFTLPPHVATENPLKAISKMRIWNYNRNIHELDVGVKRAQILVNGVLLWEGIVNKGCGSQVFDYCTEVCLDGEKGSTVPDWLPAETQSHSSVELDSDPLAVPPARPSSGRVSGLRGQLLSRQGGAATPLATPLRSSSDPHLPTFLDDQLPRLKTAVLAHGRRWFRLNSSGSDTCLLPCVGASGEGEREEEKGLPNLERRATLPTISPLATPSFSSCEPEVSARQPHPPSDLDQSLASITKFDHTHLGQLGSDHQDDILETFLSEYRQRRQQTGSDSLPPSSEEAVPGEGEEEWGEGEGGSFPIPELPSGSELVLNILSTWGDRYYLGLSGVEVFTAQGERARVEEISADPADINVLPRYSGDPRVVGNLVDGVNRTRDDTHMWLAPFTPGRNHLVRLQFSEEVTIAMVRIWNYNKSRIHSSRGAREADLYLDGKLIFTGEVARASGGLQGGTETFGETILFTTDEDILLAVAEHDDTFQGETFCYHGDEEVEPEPQRPSTADVGCGNSEFGDERPFTAACLPSQHSTATSRLTGQVLSVVLAATWGDPQYLGLTGVEVVDASGQSLPFTPQQIEVRLDQQIEVVSSELAEGGENCGGADRLVDGVNVTTDDQHMWLAPLTPGTQHTLTLTLDTPTALSALRVWNYNKSAEDTYRGVKIIHVFLDGTEISPDGGFLLRRAPGNVDYNFAQHLPFQPSTSETTDQAASQSAPGTLPRGFVYQLQLHNTWGDPYYIGLNGLEFYDASGTLIPLTEDNIAAFPDSVNVLPGVRGDVRTPDKLVDGSCDSDDGQHMWLAPLLPGIVNSVYVVFDKPQTVGAVKLWNYAKTPSRGVKEFTFLVDDLLVHSGTVPPVPSHARGILPTLHPPIDPHVISFGGQDLVGAGRLTCSSVDVQLTNDRQTLTARQQPQRPVASEALRPFTTLTVAKTRQRRWW